MPKHTHSKVQHHPYPCFSKIFSLAIFLEQKQLLHTVSTRSWIHSTLWDDSKHPAPRAIYDVRNESNIFGGRQMEWSIPFPATDTDRWYSLLDMPEEWQGAAGRYAIKKPLYLWQFDMHVFPDGDGLMQSLGSPCDVLQTRVCFKITPASPSPLLSWDISTMPESTAQRYSAERQVSLYLLNDGSFPLRMNSSITMHGDEIWFVCFLKYIMIVIGDRGDARHYLNSHSDGEVSHVCSHRPISIGISWKRAML